MVQYSVAFEATTSRPSTSRVPLASRSSAPVFSLSARPEAGWLASGRRAGSRIADPVAVLPRADVPVGVERQPAQRAGRPALADQPQRPLGERPGRAGRDPDPQHSRPVLGYLVGQVLDRVLGFLLRLDDHALSVGVPGQ